MANGAYTASHFSPVEGLTIYLIDKIMKDCFGNHINITAKGTSKMAEKIFTSLRAANTARSKECDPDGKIIPLFFATELAGECGEACNVVKKLEREKMGIRGSRSDVLKLAEEIADIVIVADLLAAIYGINLEKAITTKFNKTSLEQKLSVFLPIGEETEL